MGLPFRAKLDAKRRITIPVDECEERQLEPGDEVLVDPLKIPGSGGRKGSEAESGGAEERS